MRSIYYLPCITNCKASFGKILCLLFVLVSLSSSLQAQKDTIVIIFKPTAPPALIANIKTALNANQIGMTHPSEARLWEVQCDSMMPCYYKSVEYIDVNEVIKKVSNETKTESIGKNYKTHIPIYTNITTQEPVQYTIPELTNCTSVPIVTAEDSTAEEVIIALIDSGVDKKHSFFKFANYFTSSSRTFIGTNCFNDHKGHGTHIAGIIRFMDLLGGATQSFKIMNLQTQKTDGSGSIWNAIRAVDWANTHGADIINMSIGYVHDPLVDSIDGMQPLQVAIEKANIMNDILVVASAGNDAANIDTVKHYPSAFSSANLISVASDSCSTYFSSWFSNFGNVNVDLAAPGEDVLGPNLYGHYPEWTRKTGTSMAAGVITGAAGLLATHMSTIGDGPLKCALMAGADFKGYPVLTDGTLHVPDAKDSLLVGSCQYVPMLVGPSGSMTTEWAASEEQEDALTTYPQPFTDEINISFSAKYDSPGSWFIFDALGQMVGSGEINAVKGVNQMTMYVGHLPTGLYWLDIEMNGSTLVQKMIKQ